jgi:hypothetical protein
MRFASPLDAQRACPALDLSATLRVADYATLVAECSFPKDDYVECQLIDHKGHACRQLWGKGWVARRKDGVEVLIGKDCALRHFLNAGEANLATFKAHSAELIRQNKLRDANERLKAYLADKEYASRLRLAAERARGLRARVQLEREALPQWVLDRLRNFGDASRAVMGEEKHFEKVERNGEVIEVPDWRPFSFGVVQHPHAILPTLFVPIERKISAAENALMFGASFIATDIRKLTASLNSLKAAENCNAELDAAFAAIDSFASPANYRVLCWLGRDDHERRKVVSRALQLEGRPFKPHDAKLDLLELQKQIRARNGNREFRGIQY